MGDTMNFKVLSFEGIRPSPFNPRKDFAGQKFQELVESIRQKGVIEPIIIRPKQTKSKEPYYEIVAGERRFRASKAAGLATIPAIVRELTDDEAYDFMLIENLQRQDLSEREEAESFRAYASRHGADGIPELAEKTGIQPGYIRSRIRVLELPAKILKAWDDGKLVFGHLQQLLRLPDKEALEGKIKWLFQQLQWERGVTVKDLARDIDDDAPALGSAFFKAAESCRECPSNSAVQKELFGVETKAARCLNAACFKKRQAEWLAANWKTTAHAKRCGTNGARFSEDLDYGDFNHFGWSGKPGPKCATCESFVSIIELSGKVRDEQACVGDKGCYHAVTNPKSAKEKATGERDPEAPRASWHGAYFRDRFFRARLEDELNLEATAIPAPQWTARLGLYALLKSHREARKAVGAAIGMKRRDDWHLPGEKLDLAVINTMTEDEILRHMITAVKAVMLEGQVDISDGFSDIAVGGSERRLVGTFLGIDLAKEYAVDADYLGKKTRAEILAFGKKHKLFDKNVDPAKLKKTELVKVIMAHGPKLVGLVPAEILKDAKAKAKED